VADLHDAVNSYVGQLTGPSADDACNSLLELGPSALPHIAEALRTTKVREVRVRLAEVVAYGRAVEGLPILRQLLDDGAPKIWKIALDGLVMLGTDNAAARPTVLEILTIAQRGAGSTKLEWIVEAVEQIPSLNAIGPG
jgi:hypothetical protein